MRIPGKKVLLKELDRVDHRTRLRRMARLGHRGRETPALDTLLDELEAGDRYEQGLALQAACAARRDGRIMRALRSDSVWLGTWAAALAGRTGDAGLLEAAIPELMPAARKRLLRSVARSRRRDVAERLLPAVLEQYGPRAAVPLLAACSAATVRRILPEVAHEIGNWKGLATAHPKAVLDHLRQRVADAAPSELAGLWNRLATAVSVLAVGQAAELLDLAMELPAEAALPRALRPCLGTLSRREPERVARFLLGPACREKLLRHGAPAEVLAHLRRLPKSLRLELARLLRDSPGRLAELLEAVAPCERGALFRHATHGLDTAHHAWPAALLEALPHAERDAETRRMLELERIREDPARRLELMAYRDVDQVREALERAAAGAQAVERGRALALLVRSTGRSRHGVTATLVFLRRIRNEQDPVRQAAFNALSRMPPALIRPAHAEILSELIGYALTARDTSWLTRSAIQSLACRLLKYHAGEPEGVLFQFGLDTFRRLARHSGDLGLPLLHPDLPRGTEHRIFAVLEPRMRAADERERYALVISLAWSLGKRAWQIAGLQARLAEATRAQPEWDARGAIELWLADPQHREERIRQLLDRDPSAVCVRSVFLHLHRHRQDWLDPYLDGRPIRGRFLSGRTTWLPPATSGFQRWLPRQQRAFRKQLESVAGDRTRDDRERASAIRTLAKLPSTTAGELEGWLHGEEVILVEAALGALAWLDQPRAALPILLEHLEGDRARVAMYAVPRCARCTSPQHLNHLLRKLLSRESLKVTVHKEAIRLLASHRSPMAPELLATAWSRPELHRDVRIAFGHAARRLLDRPEAWEILETLASSTDAEVVRSLVATSPELLAAAWHPRYAALLLEVAEHGDPRLRREAFAALTAWTAGAELAIAQAAGRAVADLEGGGAWRNALRALVAACRDGRATGGLVDLVRTLRTAPVAEADDAGQERDLPARRRLLRLCRSLASLPAASRARLRNCFRDLAEELHRDVTWWPTAANLRIAALDWGNPEEVAAVLARLACDAGDEPLYMQRLARQVEESMGNHRGLWQADAVAAVLDGLDREPSAAARLVELAILKVTAERSRWTAPWVRRLRKLRSHACASVRTAALEMRTDRGTGEDGFIALGAPASSRLVGEAHSWKPRGLFTW